mmetsp:Transcript_42033/g.83146  ORF Transcript_42033/g.83146 Transcript_42033/m.83146 type:complete len:611 (+) Transcript_42033:162-1994(+)
MPSSETSLTAPTSLQLDSDGDGSTSLASPRHALLSRSMGQFETAVRDVNKRLDEIQTSTQAGMSQLHHQLGLLQAKMHFSRAFNSATSTPCGPTTTGSGTVPGSPLQETLQSTSGVVSEHVGPARLAGPDEIGSDMMQDAQVFASAVGTTERLLQAVERLRSEIEGDRSKATQTASELIRVTCTTAEIRQRLQDAEGKMQDQTLELSTMKLSLASFYKDMQTAIQKSDNAMSEEVARSVEGVERSWSQHLQQQLEKHRDEQVQLQEKTTGFWQTNAAATQSKLDRVDATLRDLAAEHAAHHEALAVQVQQLEGSRLASQKDHDIASHELTELQGEPRFLAEQVSVPRQTQAEETDVAKKEGLGVRAEVAALQANIASVNKDVSLLAKDLVEMRAEHLVAVAELGNYADQSAKLAMQQGSKAFSEAAQTRMQELEAKIHGVQVATAGEILGLTKDLGSLRIHFAGVTQVIDKLNLTLQEQQQQQQKPLQKAFFPLFSPMPSPRDKHFSPALTPRDRQQVQLASAPDLVAFRRPRSPPPLQQQHSGISVAPLAKNATSAQHSLAIAACTALPPGRLQVVQSPRAGHGTSIPAGRVASDYVERQPIRVVGADR